jgi:hypothetical protein
MRRVMVRVSKDSGRTWGNWKYRNLGEVGEYAKQVRLGPFGSGRQFVVEIRVTDPLRAHLIGASVILEPRE